MMGMIPRGIIQRWRAGEHRTSPHGEDVAWRPGYLGAEVPRASWEGAVRGGCSVCKRKC